MKTERLQKFRENPSLYVFLPIFYIIWSDSILTDDEVEDISEYIHSQSWLSESDREFLQGFLDPDAPPSPNEMRSWLQEIRKASPEMAEETREGLVDIGLRLVQLNSKNGETESVAKGIDSLVRIEEALGIISREAAFSFFLTSRRKTLADQQEIVAGFDVKLMQALLEGDQAPLIKEVKEVLKNPIFNRPTEQTSQEYRDTVLKWCQYLASKGYGAYAYPEEYGGKNDMAGYFTIFETLSYHDLSMVVKYGVQFGLFGMSIYFLGTQKHHQKYLKDIGSLTLPGCFAMTETGHGSNVKGIETTASYHIENQIFIINTPNHEARKDYIGNAACHGQMATVFAKLIIGEQDYGVNAFLVPIRDKNGNLLEGIEIEDCGLKMGLNGVDNGRIKFQEVIIPRENMLDRFAEVTEDGEFTSPISSDNRRFFTMLGTLVGGRVGVPLSGLTAAKMGLSKTIKYSNSRKQFGPEGGLEVPILNYKTHMRRLMPLLSNAYAFHFSLKHLTQRYLNRTEDDAQEIEALAAGLKSLSTWNTTHTLQTCRECSGGFGYLTEAGIDSLKNDTEVYTTFEGDNTVLMQLVAKSRLTEFRQDFSNINFFGILNYLGKQAVTTLQELNPITIRNTDPEHLLDPEFHIAAFRYRESDILVSAARRLKKHIDNGMDSFDAFNQCQDHLVQVGFAYVERVILEVFLDEIKKVEDEQCRQVLQKVYQLFALSQIEKNKGWYLEAGYLEGVKTKAIRKMVNQLCLEVRKESVFLVQAFGVPE